MAARADADYLSMIHGPQCWNEGGGGMAKVTLVRGRNVARWLAYDRGGRVVTNLATTGQNLVVVYQVDRSPRFRCREMAGIAAVGCRRVKAAFANGDRIIVAAHAGAAHLDVVYLRDCLPGGGCGGWLHMARVADIGRRRMIGGFASTTRTVMTGIAAAG